MKKNSTDPADIEAERRIALVYPYEERVQIVRRRVAQVRKRAEIQEQESTRLLNKLMKDRKLATTAAMQAALAAVRKANRKASPKVLADAAALAVAEAVEQFDLTPYQYSPHPPTPEELDVAAYYAFIKAMYEARDRLKADRALDVAADNNWPS